MSHAPVAVLTVDGMVFVKCSCTSEISPTVKRWLSDHWPGDSNSGLAALRDVAADTRAPDGEMEETNR